MSSGGITYHHPGAFWAGVIAVTAGVILHLPMYIDAREMHYAMAGMTVDGPMVAGMALIVAGLAATAYGLVPRGAPRDPAGTEVRVQALDDASITRAHVALLLAMAAAITIDVMKPVTLGFVAPGMALEYGLKSPVTPDGSLPVALLPLSGISGTVVGSLLWGWLGDRIGRRASILLAGVLFAGTSICGAMPSYQLNFLMCFIMGLGVGGMLPITFALMAETIPARHRGWLMVLIGGDVAGAYLITSWLSSELTPEFGWRIMWLLGLPTGLLLLVLNRWIPESPRFLLANGRRGEAAAVLRRYGARAVADVGSGAPAEERLGDDGWRQLVAKPFRGLSLALAVFGLGIGLVTFGFQLWIPSNLQALGFDAITADRILRDSALIGLPATLGVALAYGLWSSRNTLIVLGVLTAGALIGLVVAGDDVAQDRTLLYALLVIPITGISSILAVLIAYGAEVFPTRVRARATGVTAGASKAGGVVIIGLVAAAVTPPSIAWTAVIGAVPMVLAAVAVARYGVETRRRRLEDITAEELGAANLAPP